MTLSLTWSSFPDEGTTNYNSLARAALANLKSNGEAIETQVDLDTAAIDVVEAAIGALSAGSGVTVSADDTTAGVLDGKLLAGAGISLTVGNPAGNETLTIAQVAATGSVLGGIKVGDGLAIASGVLSSDAVPSRANYTHASSPVTMTAADCRGFKTFTNTGATAVLLMNLPAGADGLKLQAIVTAAYDFSFVANGTETIRYLDTVSKAGGSIKSAEIGHALTLEWNGTQWVASITGSYWNLEVS
jgi:hypothetical protein